LTRGVIYFSFLSNVVGMFVRFVAHFWFYVYQLAQADHCLTTT
jgi:hypothetical protein